MFIHQLRLRIAPQGSHAFRVPIKCSEENKRSHADLDAVVLYENLREKQLMGSPYSLVDATYSAMVPHLKQHNLSVELKKPLYYN